MSASPASEQLSAYLDGELTDAERAELEAALERDPALQAELARIEGAVAFLRTHGPVQAPHGFQQRVLEAVKAEPMPGSWWRWLRRPFGVPVEGLAVALVAAVVMIVALPLGLQGDPDAAREHAVGPVGFVRGDDAAPGAVLTETAPSEAGAQTYAYEVLVTDDEALERLHTLVLRMHGRVLDASGRPLDDAALAVGATYLVEVPSSSLAAFGDGLRRVGMVTETPDEAVQVDGSVRVRVGVASVGDERARAARPAAAPPPSDEARPTSDEVMAQ